LARPASATRAADRCVKARIYLDGGRVGETKGVVVRSDHHRNNLERRKPSRKSGLGKRLAMVAFAPRLVRHCDKVSG
jgi:hypothetical protein